MWFTEILQSLSYNINQGTKPHFRDFLLIALSFPDLVNNKGKIRSLIWRISLDLAKPIKELDGENTVIRGMKLTAAIESAQKLGRSYCLFEKFYRSDNEAEQELMPVKIISISI